VRRWWLLIALLLSLGVNVGILATLAASGRIDRPVRPPAGPAYGPPGPAGEDRPQLPAAAGWRLERLADGLGLAGEDRERFLELQHRMFEDGIALARERFALQAELRRELLAAEPDRQRIEILIGEISAVFTRLEENTASGILDTRELLDPEQERRYLRVVAQIRPRLLREGAGVSERPWRQRRPPGPPSP
jgi:hypothetical protein